MKKRALLIVGLAMLIATAGVVYAHWTDTLQANVNITTGFIDPQWSLTGTNDDGVGWPDEPVASSVYTYGAPTSNDPSAPAGAGNVIAVDSATMSYSGGGWAGWSCPSSHPYIVSGSWTPSSFPMEETHLWKTGAMTISPVVSYPNTPFGYTYGAGEQGFIAQAGSANGSVVLNLQCADAPASPRYDKDVADCFAALGPLAGEVNDSLTVTITNAYPSYWCTVKADLHNVGTVPVKLQSITTSGNFGSVIQTQWQGLAGCGTQLDPGETMDFYGSFHPTNPAVQTGTYSASYTFNWVNYNEYDPNACLPLGVTRHLSVPLNYSLTGWGGWSCPAGTTAIGGGVHSPAGATVGASGLAVPGAVIGGSTYPVFPHYTFGTNETGFVLQNNGTPPPIVLYVDCQS